MLAEIIGFHSNGHTTNGRTTYSRTTYNRTVSAMVCTINNMECDHLTSQGDDMNIHILQVSFFRFKVNGYKNMVSLLGGPL